MRYLWAEEEKGFIRTVVGYELVDPKQIGNPILCIYFSLIARFASIYICERE